jgi:hypothetical protein
MDKIIIRYQNLSDNNIITECNIADLISDLKSKYKGFSVNFLSERTMISNNKVYFFFSIEKIKNNQLNPGDIKQVKRNLYPKG